MLARRQELVHKRTVAVFRTAAALECCACAVVRVACEGECVPGQVMEVVEVETGQPLAASR